ncbi:ACT domain-containing protein [Polaribacter sargassicola]|uniref:ACT domain-containing protein n=1 Tax=Polaribacter sargassicola TaxID=2836891 RepID=UPI001F1EB691|nr:ACT domain-containing protein [Polaribacter sp. DS7-9]MCG1035129.1 ACT domain-containing protein [Polaribacter sp. DS7-9]
MIAEKDLQTLLKNMQPVLNTGNYVFATVKNLDGIVRADTLFEFKEEEGITIVLKKEKADTLKIKYKNTYSWITLKVHSSLDAVGLTAAFSSALTKHKISCNVVAGFYHDHIFVQTKDAEKAVIVLNNLSNKI